MQRRAKSSLYFVNFILSSLYFVNFILPSRYFVKSGFVKFYFVNSVFCQLLFCQVCILSTFILSTLILSSTCLSTMFCQLEFCQTLRSHWTQWFIFIKPIYATTFHTSPIVLLVLVWIGGQFGTQDNLAPRTIWHRHEKGTIWHQECKRGQFGTQDNLAPRV